MPAFSKPSRFVTGWITLRECAKAEGARSVFSSSADLGYVGFEYVL